ncbi:MAG TPA: two-component regulator propeller domain-containing protein, partial [Chitinophagaceae bacterium]|nr:two-component regulator propeller domain-containing protein [Chitinophagaceae bacterium]
GFIWIGAQNGLQRYDGNNFITFRHHASDLSSIPANFITSMYQDSKGNFWLIGANNKVGSFDLKRFVFKEALIKGESPYYYVPARIEELPTGETMLMREDGSCFKYDSLSNQFIKGDEVLHVPPKWKCTHFVWDTVEKKLWLACDSGLAQYNTVTRHVNYRGHNTDNDPAIKAFEKVGRVASLTLTSEGDLLFSFWPYMAGGPTIYRYNKKPGKAKEFSIGSLLGYHEINGFLQQRNGRLWIFGAAFLIEWTKNKDPFTVIARKYTREPKYEYCYKAIEDREGNIWLATDDGIYYFNPDKQIFDSYSCIRPGGQPMELNVTAAEELDDKRILVGTWGGRLLCYDQKFNPLPLPQSLREMGEYLSIWDMTVNAKTQDLWI